jgi:uncharacterized metal-binding protein
MVPFNSSGSDVQILGSSSSLLMLIDVAMPLKKAICDDRDNVGVGADVGIGVRIGVGAGVVLAVDVCEVDAGLGAP